MTTASKPQPTRPLARRRAPEPGRIFIDFRSEHEVLAQLITETALDRPGQPLRILEAGCGQRWPLKVLVDDLEITGVDLDAEAMRIRRERYGDLDHEIVADLRTVDLPPDMFDVAYCSFVLEHVEGAETVLDNLVEATRPGGRIIVRVPDRDSVYGFLVRHSPHRAHVLYKKYVEHFPDAGKSGHAPYPTVYEDVVSLGGLRDYARDHHHFVLLEYGSSAYLDVFRQTKGVVAAGLRTISALSRHRVSATHNNIGFVFQKAELP